MKHQVRISNEGGRLDFPVEPLLAARTGAVRVVADAGALGSDDVIGEERDLLAARGVRAYGRLDPKIVDNVGARQAADFLRRPGRRCLVEVEQGLAKGFARPRDLAAGKAIEGRVQFPGVNGFYFRFDDEPGDGVKVNAGDSAAEAKGLHDCGAATHEWVEDGLAVGVGVVGVGDHFEGVYVRESVYEFVSF